MPDAAAARGTFRRGIARKLLVAFSLLLAIFGGASFSGLGGLLELHEAMHLVEDQAGRMQRMLRLASAVRDQYAHMAHTIILADDTHLEMYREAAETVGRMVGEVKPLTATPQEQTLAQRIRDASSELDRIFDGQLLPAVRRGDTAAAARLHERILEIVSSAQQKADQLAAASERAILDFGGHAQAAQHVAIRWMLIFMIVAVACAVGVAVYLYRMIARPLSALASGAARIASGDLDIKLTVASNDELGQLAERFNAMTGALKEHQRKLVQSEKLAGIGRMAAGVAHEINNPLGVILGYIKLLRRDRHPGIDDELRIIDDEAERCRQVVEDMLDLTRTPPLEVDEVDLRALCDHVVRGVGVSHGGSGSQMLVEGQARVTGNGRKLHQVIHNLIKNAVEAAGTEGRVEVRIETTDAGRVSLTVADSGPGIRAQDRDFVFEPFFTTKPAGTGLGLAVSRAIARAHEGDLELVSSGDGGAVFRLTLPTDRRQAA
jgi:two-component system NtrC family sensor kinase